jgi:hypothetical protein
MSDPTQPPVEPTTPAAPAYPSYPAQGTQPPAYGQAPAYGQNPYGQQNPQDKYNVLSIISLVTSILAISLVGIITGHIALSQIKKTGEKGHGLALWGTILGYVGLVVGAFILIASIALLVAAANVGVSQP